MYMKESLRKQFEIIIKIAAFHYKLLQEILLKACKSYKWKKIQLRYCIYCKSDTQDAKYLLYECPTIQNVYSYR